MGTKPNSTVALEIGELTTEEEGVRNLYLGERS
jgi:hypothetical protein